jgi:hypothetical protein
MTPNSLAKKQARSNRRRVLAGDWRPARASAGVQDELFEASFRLAEAARAFERAADTAGSAPATGAALACLAATLDAQATGVLKLRGLVQGAVDGGRSGPTEDLRRLLFAINQNLRFATEVADLARSEAAEIFAPVASER